MENWDLNHSDILHQIESLLIRPINVNPITFYSPSGDSEPHASGMQVPWRFRIMRGENLLESHAPFPQSWQHHQGEVRRRHRGGAAQGGHHPGSGATQLAVQASHGRGPGLLGPKPRLLRAGPEDARDAGNGGPLLQQDLESHRRLRAHVLRAWFPHAGGGGGRQVQLQIPLVLLRQVQTMPQDGGDAHVSVMLSSEPLPLSFPFTELNGEKKNLCLSFLDSK